MKNITLIYTTLLFIVSCSNSDIIAEKNENNFHSETIVTLTDAQENNAHIKIGSTLKAAVPLIINCNGIIDVPPQNLISISSPINAFIKDIPVLNGTRVHKGELLVSFQHPEIIAMKKNYLEANSKYIMLAKEFERQSTLFKEEAASKKTLEQIQSDFETTKVIKNALQSQLKLLNIDVTNLSADNMSSVISLYASENGYVAKVTANKGKYMRMEDEVMQVVNTSHLHAELQVFENDIVHLRDNQEVYIHVSHDKTRLYNASIALIGSVVNPVTKTISIHAHFKNIDDKLKPGMYLSAEILVNNEPVTSLPETALIRENKNHFIFLKKSKGTYEKIAVEVVSKNDSVYAVILPAELEKSNQIVLQGATTLNNSISNAE